MTRNKPGIFVESHEEHAGRIRRSESGSAAVRDSPAGAGPTAVRETILRVGGLHHFGERRLGEAAVPGEVGPERGQPDQS